MDPVIIRKIRKPQLEQPGGGGSTGFDERVCKDSCKTKYPNYYKDPLQKEDYEECLRECERKAEEISNPTPPPTETPGECPEGKGKAYEGCPCGEIYGTKTGNCPAGYLFIKRNPEDFAGKGVKYEEGMIGTCSCEKAIADWKAKKKTKEGGEFEWSPEIQTLLQRILDRANSLLDQPLGLSEEERQAIYNRIYEKIKGMERPAIQSQMDIISRQGLLGSPYAERAITGIQRGTREMLGGAERDIEIEEAQQRFNQLMGTTGMAQSLLGSGMGAEQIAEALSAGRRGEGQTAMQMLLNYLAMIYGGQDNTYWQAIINKLLQQYGQ